MNTCSSVKTILFLAANPQNSERLRLDKEVQEIDEGLRRAARRDSFALKQQWAVRAGDIQRAILFIFLGMGKDGDSRAQASVILQSI